MKLEHDQSLIRREYAALKVTELKPDAVDAVLHDHVREFFAGHQVDVITQKDLPFETTPLQRCLPRFHVLRVAPGSTFGLWVYVSAGAWEVTADERQQHGLSEFVLSGPEHGTHLETLAMISHYHADPAHRLGPGHTVPIGRPWIPHASCDHLLISLPYPWGRDLEVCALGDDHIHLWWLLPITERERAFIAEEGLEALEQRFDDCAIEWWEPDRPSVV